MNIEQIVAEAAALPEQERKDLIGRLLAIGRDRREEAEARKQMAELIDDNDPSHWITYDELKRRLPVNAARE